MDLVPDILGTKISFKFIRFYALALKIYRITKFRA